ncbi:MAG TPA: ASKHA domain-containing protein [bacterium]|nr:ASKHA domain-containing protein [bacterium]
MKLKVTFRPENVEIAALPGLTILELARRANLAISAVCGGRGTCGKCLVRINPAPPAGPLELKRIPAARLAEGYRMACQARVTDRDLEVEVPDESRLFNLKVLVSGLSREVAVHSTLRKYYLELAPPVIEDQRSDWERLRDAAAGRAGLRPAELEVGIYLLRRLPVLLRENNFKVTAVLANRRLISVEGGDTTEHCYGVAFDLGTTSIVGALLDMRTARELAVAHRTNPQTSYGADVISRINLTLQDPDGGQRMRTAASDALGEIIAELADRAAISAHHVYEVVVAGNSAMEHLFLGLPAGSLATSPYIGVCRGPVTLSARRAGLRVNEDGFVRTAPLISGFVGGDTVAGILAVNLHREERLRLLVDIGTNGEIVAGNREGLFCASAAAGPAFEGANIHNGMRAEPGAIDKVRITDRVEYSTIAEAPVRGICGTGLLETVSELLRVGLLGPEGRFRNDSELAGLELPAAVKERLVDTPGGRAFRLDPETGVAVYQKDVRQLQLAKAAIAAGIEILLEKMSLETSDLEEVLLAGAFGSYIDPAAALRIGLLPPVRPETIRFVGNTSLAGARLMLLSTELKDEAECIPSLCGYVELFHEKDFMDLFVEKLAFPTPGLP